MRRHLHDIHGVDYPIPVHVEAGIPAGVARALAPVVGDLLDVIDIYVLIAVVVTNEDTGDIGVIVYTTLAIGYAEPSSFTPRYAPAILSDPVASIIVVPYNTFAKKLDSEGAFVVE